MVKGIFTQEALGVYFIADGVGIPFLFAGSDRLAGGLAGGLDFGEAWRHMEVQNIM